MNYHDALHVAIPMYAVPPSHSIQLKSLTFTFIDAIVSIFDPLNDNHPTAMLQKYIT